jgi:hypothetical protein
MMAGNAEQWEDLFQNSLLPSIFVLVRDAWNRICKPTPDELEKDTSLHLYCAMIQGKDRQKHPFLIKIEDPEVDIDLIEMPGRKDLVFYPSHDEDIYFCLEAKRLNALVSGVLRSLATEYVTQGMQRFVDGKYSRRVHHGGMLGYVLDGNVDKAMENVANAIQTHHQKLGMVPPGKMLDSGVRPDDAYIKETHHNRNGEVSEFQIHHLFASG